MLKTFPLGNMVERDSENSRQESLRVSKELADEDVVRRTPSRDPNRPSSTPHVRKWHVFLYISKSLDDDVSAEQRLAADCKKS